MTDEEKAALKAKTKRVILELKRVQTYIGEAEFTGLTSAVAGAEHDLRELASSVEAMKCRHR